MENLIKLRQTIIEEIEKICDKKRIGKRSLKTLNGTIENMSDLTPEQTDVIEKVKHLNNYNKLKKEDIEQIREIAQQVKELFMSNEEIMKQVDLIHGLSEKCPMNRVRYDEERKQYKITLDDEVIYEKNIKDACEIMKEEILRNEQIFSTQLYQVNKKVIKCQDKYIILFIADVENEQTILFDTTHIANLLNDIDDKKLNEITLGIELYNVCLYFEPNEYNGYTVRHMFNEHIVRQIVAKSNSKISESFEKEMNKIINEIMPTQIVQSTSDEEKIMKQVDSEAGYNYSKEKPMDGISYNEARKKYLMRIGGVQKYSNDLSKMCNSMRKEFCNKTRGTVAEIVTVCKKVIEYQNKYIISFWYKHDNEIDPLFDIKHTLKLLDVSERQREHIMSMVKDESKFIYFEPNEYNGYILRELINEKTMYQIVLDSRSAFSKSFKSDISDLLINMRKNGNIQFAGITPQKRRSTIAHSNISEIVSTEIIQVINGGIKITNDEGMSYVKSLIKKGETIHLSSYIGDHVLYFFITNILSSDDHVICKIGYTSNINKRIESLTDEYEGSKFHLIGIKRIRNVSDEKDFHSMIKHRYKQLVYNDITIKSTHKDELYIFDKCLWEEFCALVEYRNEKNMTMGDIMDEYKNGMIDRETMILMLQILNSNIELEKLKYKNN